MTEAPAVQQPPAVDWQRTPYVTAVWVLALILSAVGVLAVGIGLGAPILYGNALTIAGSVILAAGMVGWMLYAVVMFWRHESRNQLLSVVAAITREDATVE